MKKNVIVLICILTLASASCSTIRQVRPLEKGEHKVAVSAGGPLFTGLGIPLPLLMASVNYQYGISSWLTMGGSVHLTPIIFGMFGFGEINATAGIIKQSGVVPAVAVQANLHLLSDFSTDFLLFPETNIIASWRLGNSFLVYVSGGGMWNLYNEKGGGLPRDSLLVPSFVGGVQIILGQWDLSTELKLIAPFDDSSSVLFGYIGVGSNGVIAPYISVSRRFGAAEGE